VQRFAAVIRLRPEMEAEYRRCQEPLDSAAGHEWWAPAQEIFHVD
jgi:L-rhamnose mutarotase